MSGRIAEYHGVVGYVPGHHRAHTHEGVAANRYSTQQNTIGANRCPLFDLQRQELVRILLTARSSVIGVDDIGTQEGVIRVWPDSKK